MKRITQLLLLLSALTTVNPSNSAIAQTATLQSGDATLHFQDGAITVERKGQTRIHVDSIDFDYHAPLNFEVAEQSNNSIQILLTYPATVDYYSLPTDSEPRQATLEISSVDGGFRLSSHPEWADQTTIQLSDLGDATFGLTEPLQPDNRLTPNLRGATVTVEVASEGENITENYASGFSSFYLSSLGYGSFFDTFARGRYQIAVNGKSQIHHETGHLDWYLFFGDDGAEIHASYFKLIGKPKASPLWGLGPVAWRDHNEGAAEIMEDIGRMSELRIPVTSWFVDRPYSDGNHAWSEMNFSQKFSDPEIWIKSIREDYGLEFMTWTATAMFGSKRFPKHLEGKFTYLDLSHPETAAQFKSELTEKQYQVGVKGHKMDRADEVFPVYEDWHNNTIPYAERRNHYVYLFSKVHHDALQAAWGDDHVNFARAAIHRTQPYVSAIWGGDPRSNWAGLQANMANGIRASYMGFPTWGTDVGGYIGDGRIDEELYIRWMQAGSMTGLFEIKLDGAGGAGEDRMPWNYGPELQNAFRAICEDRMQLLPYLYSLSHTAHQTGALMQPMAYRHPADSETHEIWDQYYFGPNLLVAPVLKPDTKRAVYFPIGEWIDYDDPTQRIISAKGEWRPVAAPLAKLPRWIKANSILPTGNIHPANSKLWSDAPIELTLKAFPGQSGESATFDYVDPLDQNQVKTLKLARDENTIRFAAPPIPCQVTLEIHVADQSPIVKTYAPNTHIAEIIQL
ncbi:glycosyl hydrolase, family 31 [Verrucomicrobiia bacterium DG1235]|nr:glycosyl hydrolase, family 31 [Verrucomicrobiae bacterium DG1235]